jgi:hypothetical protein
VKGDWSYYTVETGQLISLIPDKMRLVSKVLAVPDPPKVRLYIGFPPEIDPDPEARQMMEAADVLLIEQNKAEMRWDFFYIGSRRLASSRATRGISTWKDAKHQANFEFDGLITPWISVPSDVKDVIRYALDRPS